MHGVHARTTCAAIANVSLVSCEADAAGGRGREPELRGHRLYFDQDAGCLDPAICAPRAGPDTAIACNRAARYAGDQGVPHVADVRVCRSDPGFGIDAALPLACRLASDEIRLRQ